MNTDHHVQRNQVQANLIVELANLEVGERTGFLERGQVHDDLEDRTATLSLVIGRPELGEDRGSHRADDGEGVPVVAVEESREGARAFQGSAFGPGVAVGFEERGEQGLEALKLVMSGEGGLDGVEYGSGLFVHRTVRLSGRNLRPTKVRAGRGKHQVQLLS